MAILTIKSISVRAISLPANTAPSGWTGIWRQEPSLHTQFSIIGHMISRHMSLFVYLVRLDSVGAAV